MDCDTKLKEHLVQGAPASLYYIPNFITKEEEDFLLDKVYSAPKPKWTQLSHRRLQNWGGLPHPKGMVAEPLPSWLQTYADKISKFGAFDGNVANHVLVNEYLPGQGIMPHEDGPLFHPVVSTLNLGSHSILDFYYHQGVKSSEESDQTEASHETETASLESRHFTSLLVEPRSLHFVCDDMYKIHLHGIAEKTQDVLSSKIVNLYATSYTENDTLERGSRVSLTIRYVPKTLKANLFFGKSKR